MSNKNLENSWLRDLQATLQNEVSCYSLTRKVAGMNKVRVSPVNPLFQVFQHLSYLFWKAFEESNNRINTFNLEGGNKFSKSSMQFYTEQSPTSRIRY